MKVCLGLHDFSVVHNRLGLLMKLKKHFPEFKVSLFIIPYDKMEDWGPSLLRREFLKEIKRHLDWIQFIPHGAVHNGSEMHAMSYERFKNETLPFIKGLLKEDELPYEKGFAPPHWRWNKDIVKVLDEEGWWGAITPAKPDMPRPKKFYQYNQCINEDFKGDVLKLHGHVHGTKNDLGKCFNNLIKLPKDTKWSFVTEFIEYGN